MNITERYEFMADRYFKETGKMAPGKDSPAAFGGTMTDEEADQNRREWSQWCEDFLSKLFSKNFAGWDY